MEPASPSKIPRRRPSASSSYGTAFPSSPTKVTSPRANRSAPPPPPPVPREDRSRTRTRERTRSTDLSLDDPATTTTTTTTRRVPPPLSINIPQTHRSRSTSTSTTTTTMTTTVGPPSTTTPTSSRSRQPSHSHPNPQSLRTPRSSHFPNSTTTTTTTTNPPPMSERPRVTSSHFRAPRERTSTGGHTLATPATYESFDFPLPTETMTPTEEREARSRAERNRRNRCCGLARLWTRSTRGEDEERRGRDDETTRLLGRDDTARQKMTRWQYVWGEVVCYAKHMLPPILVFVVLVLVVALFAYKRAMLQGPNAEEP
ncbi:hypothetical protein JCM3766R1_004837 [Sporobolomyces carnicolor]